MHRKRLGFNPVTVFIIFAPGRYFPDIDFRVKVGGKGVAVVAGIAIHDVNRIDFIKMRFQGMGAENIGYPRIKAASQQGHDAPLFKPVMVIPLPFVTEFSLIRRFVIGRIEIIHPGFEAGVHDRQILVRERHIDDQIR